MPRGIRDGSIYRDKAGNLRVRVRYTDREGRKREMKRSARSFTDAMQIKHRLYAEIEAIKAGRLVLMKPRGPYTDSPSLIGEQVNAHEEYSLAIPSAS
jgi:hypothetical protein